MMNCPEDIHDIQMDRVLASSTVIAPRRVPRPVMSNVFEVSVSLPPEDCFINLVSHTLPSSTTESFLSNNSSNPHKEQPILTPPPQGKITLNFPAEESNFS